MLATERLYAASEGLLLTAAAVEKAAAHTVETDL